MTTTIKRCPSHPWLAAAALALLLTLPAAMAGRGAHGPNGEHLDAPGPARATSTLPRMEASSELFELVATLHAGKFSVLIDRFDTNEPVLNAALEVESGGLKAKASFHADQGDYVIDDPKLLALLASPGEHGLVFTLVAGQDSDLLDGTLVAHTTAQGAHGHAHDDHDDHAHHHLGERAVWMGAGVAALGLVAGIAWWRQRRRGAGPLKGAL